MTRKRISSNMEANLYIIMGLLLVAITFLWIAKPLIPDVFFVLAAVMGFVPVIIILTGDFVKDDSETEEDWDEAKQSAIKGAALALLLIWFAVCLGEIGEERIAVAIRFMVPVLAGLGYIHFGLLFKCFQYLRYEDDDDDW